MKTIETAARLSAAGRAAHGLHRDEGLHRSPAGYAGQWRRRIVRKYQRLCTEVEEKREQKKEKHLQLAGEMLGRLAEQAERYGLKLGIENREALEEIPFGERFWILLS